MNSSSQVRKLRVVEILSTSRADFDLLSPLFRELSPRSSRAHRTGIRPRLILSGTHTQPGFGHMGSGMSAGDVIRFARNTRTGGSLEDSRWSFEKQTAQYARHLRERGAPDALVLLGDRFELLAYASLAMVSRIPVVHCHGGELTLGAIDNRVRFALSQLSDLHLVSSKESKSRLVSGGIPRERVEVVGPFALDHLRSAPRVTRKELLLALGLADPVTARFALVTLHSETMNPGRDQANLKSLRSVLDLAIQTDPKLGIVVTGPNSDPGSFGVWTALQATYSRDPRFSFRLSLGFPLYAQALRACAFMIGNSSSGIIEGPLLGTAVVNIGHRQLSRERFGPVIELESGRTLGAGRVARLASGRLGLAAASRLPGSPAKIAARRIRAFLGEIG